jgi:serine/threonine protein phosphatase 1
MGRFYVFGDIHGQAGMLDGILDRIAPDKKSDKLIFLGDYIDRGPEAKKVVDRLLALKRARYKTVFLKGNHEAMLLDSYLTGRQPEFFLSNGGEATLKSYGLEIFPPKEARLPTAHQAFFEGLKKYHTEPGYIFVHAGLRPGVALEDQVETDLFWIRDEFFEQNYDWGATVVFGHTPFHEPFQRGRMIGIDTGTAYGGHLTCLVLPDMKIIQSGNHDRSAAEPLVD